jgi:ferric-dicitrate binding protein FerR (iron transport regulator)
MNDWNRLKKEAREAIGSAWGESEPHRRWARKEIRRQAPKLAAFALSTALEMARSQRKPASPRPARVRRRKRLRKILLVAGAVALTVAVLKKKR